MLTGTPAVAVAPSTFWQALRADQVATNPKPDQVSEGRSGPPIPASSSHHPAEHPRGPGGPFKTTAAERRRVDGVRESVAATIQLARDVTDAHEAHGRRISLIMPSPGEINCSLPTDGRSRSLWNPFLPRKWGSFEDHQQACLLYTSPSPRDQRGSRMPSSA